MSVAHEATKKLIKMLLEAKQHLSWFFTLSPFNKLWQSRGDPHLKIRPIAIFAFYSLNYSFATRLQDNSRPKSPTKVETKEKITSIYCLWMADN